MHIAPLPYRLMHIFSPKAWLLVALASMAMASIAALILLSRADGPEGHLPGRIFDTVEQFLRDTVRLTFKDRAYGESSDAIFVAPKGILQKESTFKWVENSQDVEVRREEAPPASAAPVRLLDSDWTPVFSGLPHDQKKQ